MTTAKTSSKDEETRLRDGMTPDDVVASKPTPWFKVKVFLVVEWVALLIALAIPITPSKTGKPFEWPASWQEYFDEVLLAFLLGNGVLIVLFIVGWIFVRRQKKTPNR